MCAKLSPDLHGSGKNVGLNRVQANKGIMWLGNVMKRMEKLRCMTDR